MNYQPDLFDPPAPASDQAFDEWVHSPIGRDVADRFIRLAYVLKARGYDHYGAKAIIEGIRWEHNLKHGPDADGFKVNNNAVSRLARFAEDREPRLKDFFRKRQLKS